MNEKNIGILISKLREEKGLTQKDLADKLNISDKAISKWETGANLPSIEMIYKISTIFQVSFPELLKIRLEDEHADEKTIKNIMSEFDKNNKKKAKRIKIALIIAVLFIVFLIALIIFTRTYNRFKVYNISVNNNDILVNGMFVETRIRDAVVLNNVRLKNISFNSKDDFSVDIYFLNDKNEKKVIYNSSSLNDIHFSNYQTLVKINNLGDYIDNLYIRITIIDEKNKITEYEGKLQFELNFSNNKVYNDELKLSYENKDSNISLNKETITEKLLNYGFKESNELFIKTTKNYKIIYYNGTNKLSYQYEKNKLSYHYTYNLESKILKSEIFDENNIEIEHYTYDVNADKVVECYIGNCNNYDTAMKVLNENILNYLYDN